jgi:hypothetical protein
MKTMNFSVSAMFTIVTVLLFSSCTDRGLNGDEVLLSTTDLELAQDEAMADAIFEETDAIAETEVVALEESFSGLTSKSATDEIVCEIISVDHPDSVSFPKIITIDYGDGCTTIFKDDTITRSGKIIVTLTQRAFIAGSQRIITFENYFVNGVKIEGVRTVTFAGLNENSLLQYNITLEGGKLTYNDTLYCTRNSEHTREWYRGQTPLYDTVYVSGISSGINVLGENYSRSITEKLKLGQCEDFRRYWVILDGVVVTTIGDTETIIDYSNGGCDGTVTVIRGNENHELKFRTRRQVRHTRRG